VGRNEAKVSDGLFKRKGGWEYGGGEVRKMRGGDAERGGWFDQTSKEEVCPQAVGLPIGISMIVIASYRVLVLMGGEQKG
jgi:hypothetical protein